MHYEILEGKNELLALGTYVKLMRAAEALSSRLSVYLKSQGLTASQLGILEALYHFGPLHQNQLAEKILKSSGNISVVVDHLEQRKLVRRLRDEDDRRYITVELAEAGKRLIAGVFPAHAQNITDELGVLEITEQRELGRLCKKLGKDGKS